ncbi:hypothetical protein DAPPUDRAFT_249236 [Daphnia pulex]|uniref:Uncharacterized protein n=1 Tax=Daphnia pulex TaxID=6669 RepID=E9GW79_DAPPU|nr:hypothetical protein DAPPUDRAFT_249236 [Daphnia pulex]|eukprot:EFX76301.1 hypothetical protein DAPPUDRAFT_249236 [Daphnia pulex]
MELHCCHLLACIQLCRPVLNVNVHYTKMNPEASRFGKHAVQHIQIPEAE